MKHLGDFDTSAVVYGKFTTYRPSTGAPYTLAGTPALSVYKDNSTTQSTTGVTLTADFDSVTGLNHYAIDTSADGTFYAAGSFFDVVVTTGTVDSVSAVGTVVGSFTIRKNSALKPTTAGRTLDVSSTGEAGIDWANIGSPTTTVNLSGTTVKTATDVETDTADIQTRLPAALVSGRMDASVGAMAANVITAASTAADFLAEVNTEVDTALADVGLTTTVTGRIDAAISTRLASAGYTAPLDAAGTRTALGLASANLDTQLADLPTAAENADAVWDEVLTGATHNIATSAGRRLRQLTDIVIHEGTCQSGSTTNTIVLDTGASSSNGTYDPSLVFISGGTGAGQCRTMLQYTGSSRTGVVDRDWKVTPDNTSQFVILASEGRGSTNEGMAQGGTSSSITLNTLASSVDGTYIGQICYLVSGTGADQAALVTAYNGTTKVATVTTGYTSNQWATNPDTTTGYVMVPASPVMLAALNHAGATIPTVTDVTNGVLIATGGLSAAALATDAVNEIADGILDRNMATGTDSGSPTVRTPRQALRGLRNKASISGGSLTVCKEDDATTSWTATVATSPSDPISSIDPA